MMPARFVPQDPIVAAALARLGEQVETLQRERREDRSEMHEEISELKQLLKDGLSAVKTDLIEQLKPIKGELAPLTSIRKQGGAMLIGAGLAGVGFGYKFLEPILRWFGRVWS